MVKDEERDQRQRTGSPTKRELTPKPEVKSVTGQAQARQEKKPVFLVYSYTEGSWQKDKSAVIGIFRPRQQR